MTMTTTMFIAMTISIKLKLLKKLKDATGVASPVSSGTKTFFVAAG